ncbi:winged helix-turn-helix transcriptional regulator [Endozoicomonas sp. SM1973]|uniref:Winged helix-turn-helix transcriptional regulator n=1 Tax=Spartinivicinus marinus TaxID=2994442 RepID=A0A853ICV5_9GAMM|nr:MarR family winged helix-turn-helix transcriptional regulator [Spartinivicinus marinus]MCX4024730.1 MarR family winged helix-turn-helix transcriptional regulator [Spartinivicinus marinus]NYZ69692.1 winged helix-turn-helix transcriptional regulator [Spartinivicinus marinus]
MRILRSYTRHIGRRGSVEVDFGSFGLILRIGVSVVRMKDIVRIRQALLEHNITAFQFEILLAVELNEGATLLEIMSRGFLPTTSTVSTVASPLQRLAEGTPRTRGRGFIRKLKSTHNANANELYLTETGRTVLDDIKTKIDYK